MVGDSSKMICIDFLGANSISVTGNKMRLRISVPMNFRRVLKLSNSGHFLGGGEMRLGKSAINPLLHQSGM